MRAIEVGPSFRLHPVSFSAALALICGVGSAAAPASRAADLPHFEVASVRPSPPSQRELSGLYTYPGGRVVGRGCRLTYLIMVAYDVEEWQISGGPGWADLVRGEAFEIQAKPPEDSMSAHWSSISPKLPPGDEDRGMLQSLLAMPQLAARLSRFLKRPVFDRTGLEGSFDFEYRTGSDDNDSDNPGFLLTAIQQIGLNLKSGKEAGGELSL